jgi:hypothetical protein
VPCCRRFQNETESLGLFGISPANRATSLWPDRTQRNGVCSLRVGQCLRMRSLTWPKNRPPRAGNQ